MRGRARLVKPPPVGPAAGAPLASIRCGLVVAATRVGDAAVSILGEGCEASRQKAEPEEGGEPQCEGTFHDPSPFCLRDRGGRWAYRSAGEASHVRTTHAFGAHPHIVAGVVRTNCGDPTCLYRKPHPLRKGANRVS